MQYTIALLSNSLSLFTDLLKKRLDLEYAFGNAIEVKDKKITGKYIKTLEITNGINLITHEKDKVTCRIRLSDHHRRGNHSPETKITHQCNGNHGSYWDPYLGPARYPAK